jgi:tetratricopeptide (TPR) repeat protein
VQFGAVWSPDGKYLVFARARAQEPNPPGLPLAKFANDPNELQIRYDLYRIPFNNGRGGRAEPISGASDNGMSNTFPKLSPDGRWLVFVQARNGQLMRPDSRLYIVPAAGGKARLMRCNTPRMNSWHSFSPNGRWLVFSSKARSPYTQMYLTHIDADGNDTPPVLIENSTAANRAVNLPEFVNVPSGGLRAIGGPAFDYYRLYDRALYLQKEKRYDESAAAWHALLDIAPDDADAQRSLGMTLLLAGRRTEALPHLEKVREDALRRSPLAQAIYLLETGRDAEPVAVSETPTAQEQYYLALVSLRRSDKEAAVAHLRQAVALNPDYAEAHQKLAENAGQTAEALDHWREAIRLGPNNATALRRAAWILATNQALRNGPEAQALAVRALQLTSSRDSAALDTLAAAYAENNRFEDAIATARRAIAADPAQAQVIQRHVEQYEARKPWRE